MRSYKLYRRRISNFKYELEFVELAPLKRSIQHYLEAGDLQSAREAKVREVAMQDALDFLERHLTNTSREEKSWEEAGSTSRLAETHRADRV